MILSLNFPKDMTPRLESVVQLYPAGKNRACPLLAYCWLVLVLLSVTTHPNYNHILTMQHSYGNLFIENGLINN